MHNSLTTLLRRAKHASFEAARVGRVLELVANSRWRRHRLLVLCYHGVSLEDEHRWNPWLYISPSRLRQRLQALEEGGYRVLPLAEGITRLYARDLPPRSVVITFDDGYHDFVETAWPMLKEFGYPATVYLATLRCDRNVPVFNLTVPLMLWRRRGAVYDGSDLGVGELDLRTPRSRTEAWLRIQPLGERVGPEGKHAIAQRVSAAIDGAYEAITARRILTVMRPEDVVRLAGEGLDVQLHTHQHRTPRARDAFGHEIARNRERIVQLTGRQPVHFCYPSGLYQPEFLSWLREEGVTSATTCDPGIASRSSDPLLLPRLVDHEGLSTTEFGAWLTGLPSITARKAAAYRHSRPLAASAPPRTDPVTNG